MTYQNSKKLRSFFGAIEDWNQDHSQTIAALRTIAIVLRGDRGLEPKTTRDATRDATNCDRSSGRSRIGTRCSNLPLETTKIAIVLRGDRGLEHARSIGPVERIIAIVLRGDRGLELPRSRLLAQSVALRSFFGAIEDWNNK